ncbi:MAG: hypothetical protein ACYC0V_11260 [Armatimonadota bacterium]
MPNATIYLNIMWVVIILCTILLSFLFMYQRRHLGRQWGGIVISGLSLGLGAAVISVIRHTYMHLQRNVILFRTELFLAISAVILLLIFVLNIRRWTGTGSLDEKSSEE